MTVIGRRRTVRLRFIRLRASPATKVSRIEVAGPKVLKPSRSELLLGTGIIADRASFYSSRGTAMIRFVKGLVTFILNRVWWPGMGDCSRTKVLKAFRKNGIGTKQGRAVRTPQCCVARQRFTLR